MHAPWNMYWRLWQTSDTKAEMNMQYGMKITFWNACAYLVNEDGTANGDGEKNRQRYPDAGRACKRICQRAVWRI